MSEYLKLAESAARAAGILLREHYGTAMEVNEMLEYDIKLDLDVRSQDLITDHILKIFPDHAIYGEEGIGGNQESPYQWIVDPIDGTVNYFYGIPHFCISIALRKDGEIIAGVIFDPMLDEMFAVEKGGPAMLNGKPISVSNRQEMASAVVTIGFSKTRESMDAGFARYKRIAVQVRKTRMLGSAALAMAYIACGRLDAYIEEQISIWDIATGLLLVETAGGKVDLRPHPSGAEKHSIVAWNGKIPLEGEIDKT
jgi:myo-inositol-1(or 4)-monophosphatase